VDLFIYTKPTTIPLGGIVVATNTSARSLRPF
jgi:hypothetical protein